MFSSYSFKLPKLYTLSIFLFSHSNMPSLQFTTPASRKVENDYTLVLAVGAVALVGLVWYLNSRDGQKFKDNVKDTAKDAQRSAARVAENVRDNTEKARKDLADAIRK